MQVGSKEIFVTFGSTKYLPGMKTTTIHVSPLDSLVRDMFSRLQGTGLTRLMYSITRKGTKNALLETNDYSLVIHFLATYKDHYDVTIGCKAIQNMKKFRYRYAVLITILPAARPGK